MRTIFSDHQDLWACLPQGMAHSPHTSLPFSSQWPCYQPRYGRGHRLREGEVTSPRMQLLRVRAGVEPDSVGFQSPSPPRIASWSRVHLPSELTVVKIQDRVTRRGPIPDSSLRRFQPPLPPILYLIPRDSFLETRSEEAWIFLALQIGKRRPRMKM